MVKFGCRRSINCYLMYVDAGMSTIQVANPAADEKR